LTALINVCGVPHARCKDHPIERALKHDGIAQFHADFIHMTAADFDALQCDKSGTLVPLEMNFKMTLRAFLAFYHHQSRKKRGGVNILDATPGQFKNSRNSECDPTKDITPWGLAISNNKGLTDWNKLVKPSERMRLQALLRSQQLGGLQGSLYDCSRSPEPCSFGRPKPRRRR